MKLQIVSDLHLEFAPITIKNEGADILVLSGDICVAEYLTRGEASPKRQIAEERFRGFFEQVCAEFRHVVYVLGNHEHYHGRFYETYDVLRKELAYLPNLKILDDMLWECGDHIFYGATLWTNFDRDNFKAMLVQDGLNDYRLVQGRDYRKLTTRETAYAHQKTLTNLQDLTCGLPDGSVIFVGHHGPSYQSVTDDYKRGQWAHLNPGYVSSLETFIENNPQIGLWTHGHVHSSHDYVIGKTRVVANPRGYARPSGPPENENFDAGKIFEV